MGTLSFTLTKEVSKKTEKSNITSGKLSPDFSFKNFNDKITTLNDFKGKYVYIDIWATWCEPCKDELIPLQDLNKSFNNNIEFVSISVDYLKDIKQWKAFISTNKLMGTQLISDNNWYSDFIRAYKTTTIPRYILIDPQGKIVDAYAPRPSQKKLKTLFKKLHIN
jgi:thiol-disulfide isomerase/thioredoxin